MLTKLILKGALLLAVLGLAFSLLLYLTPIPNEAFSPQADLKVVKEYTKQESEKASQQLMADFGNNKKLPEGFELATLIALSHYPELKDVKIDFIVKKTPIPLASRPDIWSLFNKRQNRKYCVIISNSSLDAMEYLLMKNLPFNAQVGIVGHELAHTLYYQDKSLLQVLKMGAAYPFPKFRADFERDTDIRATYRGLGWQLISYADFVRYHPESTYTENGWIDQYYLTSKELRNLMQSIKAYNLNP